MKVYFWQLFLVTFWQEKHFCMKKAVVNIDEIDTSRQFQKHFMRAFFVQFFCQSQNVTRKMRFAQKIRT